MEQVTFSFRIDKAVLERIDAVCSSRADFIRDAVNEKLNPVVMPELSDREKKTLVKNAKTLQDYLNDAMMQRMAQNSDFLRNMSDEDFAKLVAGRLPKEAQNDSELEAEVLSLEKCLARMPSVEDMSRELNRAKGNLYKAEHERDLALALLKHGKGGLGLGELMKEIYSGAVEYAVNMVARHGLPGFGDGGGLTDAAYAEIGKKVEMELNKMEIYKGK